MLRAALRSLGVRSVLVDSAAHAVGRHGRGWWQRCDAVVLAGSGPRVIRCLHEAVAHGRPVLCGPEVLASAAASAAGGAPGSDGAAIVAASPWRFAAAIGALRETLGARAVGVPRRFRARYGGAAAASCWDSGVLVDPGAHILDVLAWCLGPLHAVAYRDDACGGYEAEAEAELALAGGPGGVVVLSRLRPLDRELVVEGATGRVVVDLARLDVPGAEVTSPRGPAGQRALHRARLAAWLAGLRDPGRADPRLAAVPTAAVIRELYERRARLAHPEGMPVETTPAMRTQLAGRRVLVTGGAGFIGARLVATLHANGADVTVTLRDPAQGVRIARYPVAVRKVDLADPTIAATLVPGHDLVMSLAYDYTRPGPDNVAFCRALADACAAAGVRRLVHVSSIVVYDDWPRRDVSEASPRSGTGSAYRAAKLAIERDLEARGKANTLDAVILQPTIVYGPYSAFWTDRFARALLAGELVLPATGLGRCNGVHVDDVVAALLAAAVATVPPGSRYIVSGPAPFAWSALFEAYGHAVDRPLHARPPVSIAPESPGSALRGLWRNPLGVARWPGVRRIFGWMRRRLGEPAMARWRERLRLIAGRGRPLIVDPAAEQPLLFTAEGACNIAAARRELGYAPRYDAATGLAATGNYLRWRYRGEGDGD
ncbi:MAG: NAD(P)-dependent oxidoreductase [Casimicrobiaceae bacterium]